MLPIENGEVQGATMLAAMDEKPFRRAQRRNGDVQRLKTVASYFFAVSILKGTFTFSQCKYAVVE